MWSCEVLVRRSCGDPGGVLYKRHLHEHLEDAMFRGARMKMLLGVLGRSCMKIL